MTDEVVSRLYGAIVDALRQRGAPDGPVKVSELYQDIVPYRAVRSELGVALNADYEHALLRLLAGERGLLRLEPEAARAELRKEAGEPYPSVGLYRKFAGSDVWITIPDDDGQDDPPVRPRPEVDPAPAAEPAPRPLDRAPGPPGPSDPAPRDAAPAAGTCAACGHELPTHREARYCPACGVDQTLRPCPECGELLEPDWRFCIACGAESTR